MKGNVRLDIPYCSEADCAENLLRETVEKYRGYIDNAPDGVFIINSEGYFTEVNRSASRITGFSSEQLLQLSIRDLLAAKSLSEGLSHFEKVMKTGAATSDLWLRHEDGSVRCFTIDAVKLSDDQIMSFAADVTDRRETEIELAERNRFVESLINMTPGVLYIYDLVERKNVYSNNGIETVLGYTIDEVQAMGDQLIPLLMHPDDLLSYLHTTLPQYASAKDNEQIVHQYRMKHKSGDWRWLSSNETIYLRKEDGSPRQIFGMIQDITESKRVQTALIESKSMAERYLNISAEIILSLDVRGNITLMNDSGHALLGYKKGELIGKNWFDTCLQTDIEGEIKEVFARLMAGDIENVANYENSVVTKNGEMRLILWHNTLLKDVDGGIVGLLCSGEDITERNRAQIAVAEEKELLATTLRSIGDGVITTDTDGVIVLMNKVAEELTGWVQCDARGQPLGSVFNIVNESTRQSCENPVDKVLSSGGIVELASHTFLVSRDGAERLVSNSGAPIRDANNKTIGVVLVFRDISVKQKLLEATQRADKLGSLGILAGGIAHDFNNLLAGLFGYIDLAREAHGKNEEISGYLDNALNALDRARDLTQQLLTFSQGGNPARETGNLEPVITNNAKFALSGANVTCEFHIAEDLHPCRFDKNQIGQVIDNVVINAQQAMPLGGKIVVTAQNVLLNTRENPALEAGAYVKVSIADAGTGIQPEILKRIFDPFFTTKQQGNGLGLATCYSIMQKHEGLIDIESVLDKGTTVHLFLPCSENDIVLESASPVLSRHQGRGKFLVMDDEDIVLNLAGEMLETMGYTVSKVQNGDAAIQCFTDSQRSEEPIVGALLDLTIAGGMGGRETAAKLKQMCPCLPLFASSGYSDDPIITRPTEYGFTDSLAKPYRRSEMSEMLNRHLHIYPRPMSGRGGRTTPPL